MLFFDLKRRLALQAYLFLSLWRPNPPCLMVLVFLGGFFWLNFSTMFCIFSTSWGVFRCFFAPPSFHFFELLGGLWAVFLPPKFLLFQTSWGCPLYLFIFDKKNAPHFLWVAFFLRLSLIRFYISFHYSHTNLHFEHFLVQLLHLAL